MNPSLQEFLDACLHAESTTCTPHMRELLTVLARDAKRYQTVKRLMEEAYGDGWEGDVYDSMMDDRA